MTAITVTNAITYPSANTITGETFARYIDYIDRGEATTRAYIINLRQFAAWMKYAGITRPTRADVIAFREYLTHEHDAIILDADAPEGYAYRLDAAGNRIAITCKPNTIKQYLRSVCSFFKWTALEGIYPNVADGIHAPKVATDVHRKEALTPTDVLAIETSITATAQAKADTARHAAKDADGRAQRADEQGKRLNAMYLLTVTAGLRCIELHRANIRDIEAKNGNAVLYIHGKGHNEADQRKPLAPEVYQAIREYLSTRADTTGNAPLFTSTGNRSNGKRIAVTTISTMLKQAMRDAGYNSERITAHSLRHTAGTAAMQVTGGNLYATQKYMRHANPATTEIYLHTDDEKRDSDIAAQVYGLYHGRETSTKDELASSIAAMTPEKLEQLARIAAAMV